MRQIKVQLFFVAMLIGAIAVLRYSPVGDFLTFENLMRHRETLLFSVQNHYVLSMILFIMVYTFAVGASVPGAEILTIAGGFLFGTVFAVVYVNIGATAGSVLAFLSARYLLGTSLQRKYQAQLLAFNEEIAKNGSTYLLTLRLIPVVPFFLVNFLSGLTKIPIRTFVWTTSLGILPASAIYAFAGKQLRTMQSPSEIFSINIMLVFAALVLFSMLPIVIKHIQKKRIKQ